MPPRKKPYRAPIPGSTTGVGDLANALAGIQKAGNRRKGAAVKRHSNNPSRVPVKEGLRVTTRQNLPSESEIESRTSSVLAEGGRSEGMPTIADLVGGARRPGSAYDEIVLGGGVELAGIEGGDDTTTRVEYLSPPPTINPGRARATEASYNRDTKTLRVVFRSGGTYAYYGVPLSVWRALQRNRSFGQTLDRLVINTYPFEKTAFV